VNLIVYQPVSRIESGFGLALLYLTFRIARPHSLPVRSYAILCSLF
jgi:hypothetical protein